MTEEDIVNEWLKDSKWEYGTKNLTEGLLKNRELHAKYLKIYEHARTQKRKYEAIHKRLLWKKKLFYRVGPDSREKTEELERKGWERPSWGDTKDKGLLDEVLESDKQLIISQERIDAEISKIDLCKEILKKIHGIGFEFGRVVEWVKWNGEQVTKGLEE